MLALPCQRKARVGHYEWTLFRDKLTLSDGESSGDNGFSERCLLLSPSDPRFLMTQKVVRCPYCVLGVQLRPMAPRLDGRFVCEKCGHVSFPEGTNFTCSCYRCGELHSSRINRDLNPVLKIKSAAS